MNNLSVKDEIYFLTSKLLQDPIYRNRGDDQEQLKKLSEKYEWELLISYDCRRRLTQYGQFERVISSEQKVNGVLEFDEVLEDKTSVDWIGSEVYGKPKILKYQFEILNLRLKEEH